MPRYRKKPVEVDAIQLNWRNWNAVCEFLRDKFTKGKRTEEYSDPCGDEPPFIELMIPTPEGDMLARHGDYIIRGIKGEYYPCKPDIFEKTYDLVSA